MIVALAGRRISAPDAKVSRFPLTRVELVRGRLHNLFSENAVTALVCSGACGADLLALSVAGEFGIRRRVVLPFAREIFRGTSVVNRPGNWGSMFDAICNEVAEEGDLIVLGCSVDDKAAYSVASSAILDEAVQLQTGKGKYEHPILAVIVWEGAPRGDNDLTAAFAEEAAARGFAVEEILTE